MTGESKVLEMKTRFLSLNGAVTLSALALVVLIWATLLDWHYIYPEFKLAVNTVGLAALGFAAFFGGWIWALLSAVRGSRRGLVSLLLYAVLLVLYAIGDLIVYCPTSCTRVWWYYLFNWTNLVLGSLVTLTIAMQLRSSSPHPV